MTQNPVLMVRVAANDNRLPKPAPSSQMSRFRPLWLSVALLAGQWAATLAVQGITGTAWKDVLLGASTAATLIVVMEALTEKRFYDWLNDTF